MHHHFKAIHMNATPADLEGNEGVGRYVLLPGSDGRAKQIAEHFDDLTIKTHSRGHNLYCGTISADGHPIDVAVIASGMGCPSMEIFLHELFHLGAKRFLRIGTAGSLQPWVRMGNLINVQASVRDENTTTCYVPLEFPAIASLEVTSAIMIAAQHLNLFDDLHTGVVHCKSALYAREFTAGPRAEENKKYLNLLTQAGVLATEMETATLFIQSQIYNHQLQMNGESSHAQVLAGAILSIIATPEGGFDTSEKTTPAINSSIELGLETVKILAMQELD